MAANIVRFLFLMLLALLVGTMFGIWVGFNPSQLSAGTYVEQQQNAIRSLNTLLPALGAACIVLATALAVMSRSSPLRRNLLLGCIALLVFSAVVTRLANQPINAMVITWSPQAPPPEWAQLRDQWWQWHIVRTSTAIIALAFAIMAFLGVPQSTERAP